jgi:putative ABC transport system permease protein
MLALHHTISLRYLRQRWSRTLLVIASIALGVGTLVATRALNQSMQRATRGAVTPMAGLGDLFVTNGEQGVSAKLVDELRQAAIPGIKDVQPLIVGRLVLPELNNRSAALVGIELPSGADTATNAWGIEAHLTNPRALISGERPAFVGSELAGLLPADAMLFRIRAAGQDSQLALAGTVEATGPAASLGGRVVFLRLTDAAAVLGRPGQVSRIDLTLEGGVEREQARQRVETVLAGRAQVRSPEANDKMVQDVIGGIELGFALGGLGALVVGLFLVYNALSVSVAERRHDIGILRSVGATRLQIAGLFAGEACVLGLVGAGLGVPLGMGLAELSAGPVRQVLSDIFLPLEGGTRVRFTATSVIVAVVAGVLTALLASLVPAIQAAREEPADAVRRVPRLAGWRTRLVQAAGSGTLIAAGMACFFLHDALPDRWGTYMSVALMLLGGLLAMPLFSAALTRLIQPIVRRALGIEGRLAADNLARSPGRTGLVIAALAAGTALMIETAGLTYSSEEAILDWVHQAFASELVVTANSPIAGSGDSLEMDERIGRAIAAYPEVETVLPLRFRRPTFRDRHMVFLTALDAAAYARSAGSRADLPGRELYPLLAEPGTVLVSENFAALYGVRRGDVVHLPGKHGPVPLRVIGTVLDYSWNRGSLLIDRTFYREQFGDSLVDAFDVFLKPDTDPVAIRHRIMEEAGKAEALVVMTREEVRQTIVGMIRRLYGISYAQQLVVMMVAALGVIMALLISVLQRRRELGLLRAVGASRFQVLRSLLAEAALMGLMGAVIGVLLGIPLEWYAVRVILFEETGFIFPVRIPWTDVGLVICLGSAVAVLAGLVPALHAMRMRIAEAIAYE